MYDIESNQSTESITTAGMWKECQISENATKTFLKEYFIGQNG